MSLILLLRAQVRATAGRNPEPIAAVIDSQSVRAPDTVPKASRGYCAAAWPEGWQAMSHGFAAGGHQAAGAPAEQWVDAARRISPALLIELINLVGLRFEEHLATLDLDAVGCPVEWATAPGERQQISNDALGNARPRPDFQTLT